MLLYMNSFTNKIKQATEPLLTAEEIELVLKLLGTTHFPVKDIEVLYRAIFKLQEEYSKLKGNQK